MIKSILGGKSKNLFDIDKFVDTNSVKRNGNSLICLVYGTSIGTLGSICPTLKPSDLITISFKCTSEGFASNFMAFNGRTFPSGATFLVSEIGLSSTWYLYSTDWEHRDIPNKTTYSDIQVELGSTATEYVPHELTSYKSIMKVGNGRFVTSFDERMPCKTKNLFSSSTEVGTLEGGFGGPTVARNFEENKWYQGFATNGYYNPGNVPGFDIHPNSLYVYSNGLAYGMSRAIKCEPNTNYFIFCSYSPISGGEGSVYVGYFDEGGNFISNLNMDMKYKFVVTTPSNCKWLIINFTTRGVGKVYFSDIQLVKGTTATDYVPYGYV